MPDAGTSNTAGRPESGARNVLQFSADDVFVVIKISDIVLVVFVVQLVYSETAGGADGLVIDAFENLAVGHGREICFLYNRSAGKPFVKIPDAVCCNNISKHPLEHENALKKGLLFIFHLLFSPFKDNNGHAYNHYT